MKVLSLEGLTDFISKFKSWVTANFSTKSEVSAKQDKLTAGTNVTISGTTISAKDTTYGAASTSSAGLMSASDKSKLDGIATGANKITVDSALSTSSTNPVQNKVVTEALNGKLSTSGTAAKATADASGNTITSTYETKANAITGLSVSGRTITYTKGDGTTGTITTQDNNTDTKVKQTNSTGTSAYPILLKNGTGTGAVTNGVLFDDGVTIQPSTGTLTAPIFKGKVQEYREDITGQTLDIDTLNLSSGTPDIMRYIEKTDVGADNITNIPVAGKPFILDVELIRWASSTDYVTMQRFISRNAMANEYVRYCTNGTWGEWGKRVFTDNNTTYSVATTSANGLMSASDKSKLDGIATGATKITVDTALSTSSTNPVQNKLVTSALNGKLSTSGTAVKATADASGNNIVDTYETKANAITGLSVSGKVITYTKGNGDTGTITTQDTNTTYSVATTSANGLMSSTDKSKLDGIATGANKTTVDSSLSSSSTNPVQNKVINSALAGKASSTHTHTLSVTETVYNYTTTSLGTVTYTVEGYTTDNKSTLDVYINGLRAIPTTDYTLDGNIVTTTETIEANQTLTFIVRKFALG